MPQIGSSIRARWTYVVSDKGDLHTAFAFESVVDEVVFIIGPALVTTLGRHGAPARRSRLRRHCDGRRDLGARRPEAHRTAGHQRGRGDDRARCRGGSWRLDRLRLGHGRAARRRRGGHRRLRRRSSGSGSLSGLMLAIWAVGSLVSGIITGAIRPKAGNATRFRLGDVRPRPADAATAVRGRVPLFGVLLFVSGFAISPTLIAACALIEEAVPAGRITEGSRCSPPGSAPAWLPEPHSSAFSSTIGRRRPASGFRRPRDCWGHHRGGAALGQLGRILLLHESRGAGAADLGQSAGALHRRDQIWLPASRVIVGLRDRPRRGGLGDLVYMGHGGTIAGVGPGCAFGRGCSR